jgi:PAS domain S-box-containing protein
MSTKQNMPVNLVNMRGSELLASDSREVYRQKMARIMLDSMVQFVGLLDASGTVLEVNQAALDALGIKFSDVEGKPFWTTFWWQVSEEVNATLRESILRASKGECVRWDVEIYGRAGGKQTIIIDASLTPVKDEQGNIVFITFEGRDITEKKANELEIARWREQAAQLASLKEKELVVNNERKLAQEASQRLSAIVASSDDAIVSKDLRGVVTSWNASAEKMFGFSAEEMIGEPITKIIPPELHADETRILSTIARGERIEHFETVRVTKYGERVEVSLTVSPLKDETGKIVGAAKIARDITQRKKAENALHTAERLASVGRLAATIAHEINNPLEALTNLVYLARHAENQEDAQRYLVGAEEELERVSHLTRQTLGFYRETKTASKVRIGSLVTPLLTVFGSRTRNKGVEISAEVDDDPEINAVPGEIRQLVANLVGNSIDAVNGGGRIRVRVSAAKRRGATPAEGVRITVADNGSGISRELRAQLFEPFFTTKKEVGTGLGLWVCKSIVEKHRGVIRVKSSTRPGKSWTVFSVFLPLDADEPLASEDAIRRAV